MFKIKINRDSIRLNKGYAKQKKLGNSGESVITTLVGAPRYVMKLGFWRGGSFIEQEYSGMGLDKEGNLIKPYLHSESVITSIDKQVKPYKNISIEKQYSRTRLLGFTLGEPSKYLYNYIPTEVICCECLSTFLDIYMKEFDDWDCYYDRVCPVCGEPDCCELEYEKLTEKELEEIYKEKNNE